MADAIDCEKASWLYGTQRVMGEQSLNRRERRQLWDHAQECGCRNYPPDWWPQKGKGWRA